jgi:hypothetical protein
MTKWWSNDALCRHHGFLLRTELHGTTAYEGVLFNSELISISEPFRGTKFKAIRRLKSSSKSRTPQYFFFGLFSREVHFWQRSWRICTEFAVKKKGSLIKTQGISVLFTLFFKVDILLQKTLLVCRQSWACQLYFEPNRTPPFWVASSPWRFKKGFAESNHPLVGPVPHGVLEVSKKRFLIFDLYYWIMPCYGCFLLTFRKESNLEYFS